MQDRHTYVVIPQQGVRRVLERIALAPHLCCTLWLHITLRAVTTLDDGCTGWMNSLYIHWPALLFPPGQHSYLLHCLQFFHR